MNKQTKTNNFVFKLTTKNTQKHTNKSQERKKKPNKNNKPHNGRVSQKINK